MPHLALNYINRGNFDGYDFSLEDLIADDQLHELDLSGIVPLSSVNKLVYLNLTTRNTLVGTWIFFQETGYVNAHNAEFVRILVADEKHNASIWVKLDAECKIQYRMQNIGEWTQANIIVRGWIGN